MKEDALALAEDVESTIGGCYGCLLDKRGLCKADSDFDCNDEVCKFVAHRLRAIVVRDAEDDTTVSAYDLLPEDEREAIAWVREIGGVEAAKARMMPEGCEWPRYEDGTPVWFGDEASRLGEVFKVSGIGLYLDGSYALNFRAYSKDERVKRPAPKVVDADGVEIKQGDTVYVLGFGEPLTVKGFTDDGRVLMSFHDDNSLGYKPSKLTHEQPDSWERIWEDATLSPWAYADRRGIEVPDYHNEPDIADVVEPVLADVVRRCRALAERGE